jgi:hypothetical protein
LLTLCLSRGIHRDTCSRPFPLLTWLLQKEGKSFHTVQVTRRFEIKPIFEVSASVRPANASNNLFVINLELNNVTASSAVELTQVTTLSPSWKCTPLQEHNL